jgi:hypothetical protein
MLTSVGSAQAGERRTIEIRRHSVYAALVGLLVFALASASPNVQLQSSANVGDTPLYQRYGENVRAGLIPYGDFYMEYPPGALPVFVAPTVGEPGSYTRTSKLLQLLLGATCVGLIVLATATVARRPRDLYIAALLFAVTPVLLGRITFARFDFWPSVLALAAVVLALRGRDRLGSATLAVATAAKVYPVVLLPIFLLRAARSGGRRAALESFAVFAAVLAAIFVPLAVVGAGGLWFSLTSQLRRPLQIESLGGSLMLALGELGLYEPRVVLSHGSHNLAGPGAAAVAAAISLVALVALVLTWVWFGRSRRGAAEFLTAAAAAVAAFVAFGRVLSPQYLIWLIPLVPLARGRRGLWAALLLLLACVLTQIWAQGRYGDLVNLTSISWAVLARNFVLVLVALLLVLTLKGYARRART